MPKYRPWGLVFMENKWCPLKKKCRSVHVRCLKSQENFKLMLGTLKLNARPHPPNSHLSLLRSVLHAEGVVYLTVRVRHSDMSICIFSFVFYLQNKTLLKNILHVISGFQILDLECCLLSLLFDQ